MVYQGRARPPCNLFRGIWWHTLRREFAQDRGRGFWGEKVVLDSEGKDRRGRGTCKLVYGISKFRAAVCCRSRQFRRVAQVSSVLTTAIEVRVLRFLACEIRIRCITLRSSKSLERETENFKLSLPIFNFSRCALSRQDLKKRTDRTNPILSNICIFPDWSFAVHSHDRGEVPGWQTDGRVIDIGWRASHSLSLSLNQPGRGKRDAHALFDTSSTYVSTRLNALERPRWHCLPFVFIEKPNHHGFLSTFHSNRLLYIYWIIFDK